MLVIINSLRSNNLLNSKLTFINLDLRQEEMPEPVDATKISQSSLQDEELDLTLIDDTQIENKNTSVLFNQENQQPQQRSQIQSNQIQEIKTNANASANTVKSSQNQSENLILNKILDKIKKQREEITHKASQLNQDESLDSTGPLPIDEQIDSQSEDRVDNGKQIQPNIRIPSRIEDDFDEEERDSISLVLNSDISEAQLIKHDKENVRNIMMSSHNVSSLMIDSNRSLLNAKMNSRLRSRGVAGQNGNVMGNRVDFRNTRAYSVDLSHASREPILAGEKEIFNKNASF